jgi:Serine dehydrogenase proteinase
MSKATRIKLIKSIQSKRNSKVLTLVTSDRLNLHQPIHQMMNDVIYDQLRTIKSKAKDFENIDLFIFSRGGDSDAPWSIVSTIRETFPDKKFNVLIPFRAHSAATMISLGADEIVMSEKAELGPVDITISNSPLNPPHPVTKAPIDISVEDVMGFIALLDKLECSRPEEKIRSFEILSEHINPLAIGKVYRLLEQTKLVANRMLSSRKNSLSVDENEEIIRKLGSEIYSHRHSISRTEARQIGLSFVKNAEDYKVELLMWKLYLDYSKELELREPFNPEKYLIDNNVDNHKWQDLKKAMIETEHESYCQLCDIEAKRIRQISQPINLNPQIALPPIPPELNEHQIQEFLQNWLSTNLALHLRETTIVAIEAFLKTQPSGQIELKITDKLWMKNK